MHAIFFTQSEMLALEAIGVELLRTADSRSGMLLGKCLLWRSLNR